MYKQRNSKNLKLNKLLAKKQYLKSHLQQYFLNSKIYLEYILLSIASKLLRYYKTRMTTSIKAKLMKYDVV